MSAHRAPARRLLTAGLVTLSALLVFGPAATVYSGGKKPSKASLAPYLNQLNALFTSWDLNGDNFLDKDELAKAFRGPKAKPFDAPPEDKGAKKKDSSSVKVASLALVSLPEPGLAANWILAEVLSQPKEKSSAPANPAKTDYSRFPDYLFLTQLDTDKDQQISKKEWDTWAHGYAIQLKTQDDLTKKILDLEAKLLKATSAKARQNLQKDLKHQQQEIANLQKQMNQSIQKLLGGKK
jgi:hypothetical protein